MRKIVWRLRGSTDRDVECCIDQTISKAHAVTVVLGHDTFLRETYPDERSALGRASQIREGLLKSGTWTMVGDAAARVRSR